MVGVGVVMLVIAVAEVDVDVAVADLLGAGVIAIAQADAVRVLAALPSGQLDVDPILDRARTVDRALPKTLALVASSAQLSASMLLETTRIAFAGPLSR